MTHDETYHGWKNFATWATALWLGNDEDLYRQISQRTYHEDPYISAQLLKQWITEDMNPLIDQNSLYSDLLNSELQQVDWLEVVEHFREEEDK